jgi:type IV pilus assembly protein PilA
VSGVGSLKAGVKIGPCPQSKDGAGIGSTRRRVMSMLIRKQLKKSRKGFTLVEVIVVLVILAILAAIAIPALTGYIQRANEKKVISKTRTTVMAAQSIISEGYGTNKLPLTAGDLTCSKLQSLTGDASITSVWAVGVTSNHAIHQLAVGDGDTMTGYFYITNGAARYTIEDPTGDNAWWTSSSTPADSTYAGALSN